MRDYLNRHGRSQRGAPLMNCISKYRATRRSEISDGLLITLNNGAFTFNTYTNGQVLGNNDYVISREAVSEIFRHGRIKSLEVSACDGDVIIIEFSTFICNDPEPGGDGIKVKIPTPGAR